MVHLSFKFDFVNNTIAAREPCGQVNGRDLAPLDDIARTELAATRNLQGADKSDHCSDILTPSFITRTSATVSSLVFSIKAIAFNGPAAAVSLNVVASQTRTPSR